MGKCKGNKIVIVRQPGQSISKTTGVMRCFQYALVSTKLFNVCGEKKLDMHNIRHVVLMLWFFVFFLLYTQLSSFFSITMNAMLFYLEPNVEKSAWLLYTSPLSPRDYFLLRLS